MDKAARHENLMTEYHALGRGVFSHPFAPVKSRWDGLARVYSAFEVNSRHLQTWISASDDVADFKLVMLGATEQSAKRRKRYHDELFRLLANYLASYAALVDHSRNAMRHHKDASFYTEYTERVATLSSAPVSAFLRDLRNYTLHTAVPPLSISIRAQDGQAVLDITLDCQKLLSRYKWKAVARSFIEGKQQIVLLDAVRAHGAMTREFNLWLDGRLRADLSVEIEAYNAVLDSYNNFWYVNLSGRGADDEK